MMKRQKSAEIRKAYFHIVLPAFFGAFGMALYYFTDGLFIGNAVGDDGMSAITVSWNIVLFLTAVAGGIGTGGSIRFTIALGKSGIDAAASVLKTILLLLGTLSLVLTAGMLALEDELLRLLGADGAVLALSRQYSTTVLIGIPVQLVGLGLLPLVRNMGGHKLASIAMSCGYGLNFLLDWLLMVCVRWGMLGCSLAYLAGQTVIAVPCAWFVLRRYLVQYRGRGGSGGLLRCAGQILATGAAPFGIYFSQAIVAIVLSRSFLTFGGSTALAGYTVVVYAAGIVNTLHRTIMEGSQPLISKYAAARNPRAANAAAGWMYAFSMALILAGAVLTVVLKRQIAELFGVSGLVIAQVTRWLPFYLLGYLCISFSRTAVSHFSAIDKLLPATFLTYLEPASVVVLVSILPRWLDGRGVWIAIVAAYLLAGLCAAGLLQRTLARVSRAEG